VLKYQHNLHNGRCSLENCKFSKLTIFSANYLVAFFRRIISSHFSANYFVRFSANYLVTFFRPIISSHLLANYFVTFFRQNYFVTFFGKLFCQIFGKLFGHIFRPIKKRLNFGQTICEIYLSQLFRPNNWAYDFSQLFGPSIVHQFLA